MSRKAIVLLLLAVAGLSSPMLAQSSSASSKGKTKASTAQAPYTMKAYSRMVTLDVVVENRKGHHITGLKASDFEIEEKTPSLSNKKLVQKISDLREVHTAALRPPFEAPANLASGVYTNAVLIQKDPVPPTVLLVDGINTQLKYQAQVHEQMLKMLRQLPPNVPVAVLLMGDHLRMLQSFTTDPKLVQKALAEAESPTGQGLGHLNPVDDPDAAGNQLYGQEQISSNGMVVQNRGLDQMIAAAKEFDQLELRADIQERFERTYEAFLSMARSLQGYPGRKNVLWLSTSFPLTLKVLPQNKLDPSFAPLASRLDLQPEMRLLGQALQDAKVAVYPVDIGGVRNLQVYSADARPSNPFASAVTPVDGQRVLGAASRQIDMQSNEQDTMYGIAKDTGGKVCLGNNDLAKCIQKAVRDSSDFYEISYYPNSGHWNGEFRRIFVKVKEHGAHLSYRRGYYATPEGSPDPKAQAAAMRQDCGALLNATGILFTAKSLPPDVPGRLRFRLAIDPTDLTFKPTPNGERRLNLEVGVCTYNGRGWSQKLMAYPLNVGLSAKSYRALIDGGHLLDSIYVPGPKPSAVRVIVKDVPSGKMGSVYIRTGKKK